MVGKYKVVSICGSSRFKEAILQARHDLTLEGCIVLSPELFAHSGDSVCWQDGMKDFLNDMHKRKIDMSDEIFVVNPGGYIGEDTRSEIEYAKRNGRVVRFLEEPGVKKEKEYA